MLGLGAMGNACYSPNPGNSGHVLKGNRKMAIIDRWPLFTGSLGACHTYGNKRDTNHRFLHRDRNLEIFTSVDIKISLIISISIALQIARYLAQLFCIAV